MPLPTWMRRALLTTAVMNVGAAVLFLPPFGALRALAGMPPTAPPFYLLTVCLFVLLFGLGYLWAGVTGEADRLFIAVAAAGKIGFVTLLIALWGAGSLTAQAPITGSPDLVFGVLFLIYLFGSGSRG